MAEQLLKICKAVENKWARSAITLRAAAGLLKQPFHHRAPRLSPHIHILSTQLSTARGERLGLKRSPGQPGCEAQVVCSEGEAHETKGKIVSQTSMGGTFMAAGTASSVPTVAPSPLTWGSVSSPCTWLPAMRKRFPIPVRWVSESLELCDVPVHSRPAVYHNGELVLAHFAGLARQMV